MGKVERSCSAVGERLPRMKEQMRSMVWSRQEGPKYYSLLTGGLKKILSAETSSPLLRFSQQKTSSPRLIQTSQQCPSSLSISQVREMGYFKYIPSNRSRAHETNLILPRGSDVFYSLYADTKFSPGKLNFPPVTT